MNLSKRDLIKSAAFGSLALGLPLKGAGALAQTNTTGPATQRIPWQNWSGLQKCYPARRVAPKSLDELTSLVKAAPGIVRPVASGHSFQALVPTDDTIVSLRNFSGLLSHDADNLQATLGAGSTLGSIGAPLSAIGQALPNMPDIDKQTLAGSFSTGTHGTGKTLSALHDHLIGLKFLTAAGDLMTCSADENSEVFNAARVSLGSLGVMTECTLQNLPNTRLKRRTWVEKIGPFLERAEQLAEDNLSFEFFYIPFSGYALVTTINKTDDPIVPRGTSADEDGLMDLKALRDMLGWFPALRHWLTDLAIKGTEVEEHVDEWWKIFPSERRTRFNEMEYHLPQETGIAALKEIRTALERQHSEIFFPIEFRYVREDDAWLSPFYQRPSCSIAVHCYYEEDHKPYFKTIEAIHQRYDGRPHWGKLHTRNAADFAALYPKWSDFLEVRATLDPHGKFLNTHLKSVFGV